MTVWYNEIDPYCAAWLRNLITANLIAPGVVDERPIQDVRPYDLNGFVQCHFFAGIGGWSRALRLSGWGDDRPVWTGSCPCQPFSAAGRGLGFADERHLLPFWQHLIAQFRPSTIFGEQVASPLGCEWFAGVRSDLEAETYAVGAADLCAAGVAAPHPRQRLYWMGVADSDGWPARYPAATPVGYGHPIEPASRQYFNGMGNTDGGEQHWWNGPLQVGWNAIEAVVERGGRQHRAQWRIKPGLSIVAYGIPNRVERCRAAGNAIVPQVAAAFIGAPM